MNIIKLPPSQIKIVYRYILKKEWNIKIINGYIALINPINNDTFIRRNGMWECL